MRIWIKIVISFRHPICWVAKGSIDPNEIVPLSSGSPPIFDRNASIFSPIPFSRGRRIGRGILLQYFGSCEKREYTKYWYFLIFIFIFKFPHNISNTFSGEKADLVSCNFTGEMAQETFDRLLCTRNRGVESFSEAVKQNQIYKISKLPKILLVEMVYPINQEDWSNS